MSARSEEATRDFERLEALFHNALSLTADARGAFVADVVRQDASLGQTLTELLAAHDSPALPETVPFAQTHGLIGPYTLGSIRGSGGSGVVYEAEREGSTYALKLFHTRSDRAERASLEREIAALQRVRHGNVATLVDHGEDTDGRLFLVTELARGCSLADWVRTATPTRDERIAVVEAAARAIQVAHENGVVHRDLKPSNILVSRIDGVWQPKIIDFGVARVRAHAGAGALATLGATGRIVGTLAYMSPEQADDSRSVDERSDVHALAAILYELLTGGLPHRIDDVPIDRAIVRIRSVPPRRADDVDPSLPRPLADVLAQALALDPRDRYPSAVAFADDLSRFRSGRRVAARPLGLAVRATRWIARHPRTVLVAIITLFALGGAGFAFAWLASEAKLARAAARASEQAESEVRNLFVSALKGASQRWSESHVPTLREFADSAADALSVRGEGFVERVGLGLLLGDIYLALGSAERALPLLEAALVDRESRFGRDSELTIETTYSLARATMLASDHRRARGLTERVAEWNRARLPGRAIPLLEAIRMLISIDVQSGAIASASALVEEAERLAALPGVPSSEAFELLAIDAALVARLKGDVTGAEQRIHSVLDQLIHRFGAESRPVVLARVELANGALARQRFELAHEQFSLAYDAAMRMSGTAIEGELTEATPVDPWTASLLACRAQSAIGLGRFEEAKRDLRRALDVIEKRFGSDNASAIGIHLELARMGHGNRELEPMLEHSERALAIAERLFDAQAANLLEPLEMRGLALAAAGRPAEAIACLERGVVIDSPALANDPRRLRLLLRKGMLENLTGSPAAGFETLRPLATVSEGEGLVSADIRLVAAEHAALAAAQLGNLDATRALLESARAAAERLGATQRITEIETLRGRLLGAETVKKTENP